MAPVVVFPTLSPPELQLPPADVRSAVRESRKDFDVELLCSEPLLCNVSPPNIITTKCDDIQRTYITNNI